jgi:intracellular sulfur oxidation DsrE/DsrF family protein
MRADKNNPDNELEPANARRAMVTGMGLAVAGLAASAVAGKATAQDSRASTSGFEPARHELDAWLDEATGDHRIFVDSSTGLGGAEAVLYSSNLFNAHRNAYNGSDSDLDIVICFRHYSTPFGYSNAVWKKYGEAIHQIVQYPQVEQAPDANPLNTTGNPTAANAGITIDSLVARGAKIAICENATRFFSGQLAAAADVSANAVYDELIGNAVEGGRFVSAGVIALTRAQEYGYSLLYAG